MNELKKQMMQQVGGDKFIPLLPRYNIYLYKFGYADDERFARVFRETWPRIPLGARRAILAQWREADRQTCIAPTIEVLPTWSTAGLEHLEEKGHSRGYPEDSLTKCLGMCSGRGREIRFHARAVDAMPDDILSTLIAHELAHVYTPTTAAFNQTEADGYMSFEYEEELNRDIVEDWGFDEYALSDWAYANGALLYEPPLS